MKQHFAGNNRISGPFFASWGVALGALLWVSVAQATAISSEAIVRLANDDREQAGLEALTVNGALTRAAELKAEDMAMRGYFAHVSPEGKTPWYWFGQAGYSYRYAGENLAIRFENAEEEQAAWMRSPSHRSNILNPKYLETGVAVRSTMEDGRPVLIAVQLFGTSVGEVLPAASERGIRPENDALAPITGTGPVVSRADIDRSISKVEPSVPDARDLLSLLRSRGLDPVSLGFVTLIGVLELVSAVIVGHMARRRLPGAVSHPVGFGRGA